MRTYPYVQSSLAILVLVAASISCTLVCPQDAMAREPEYEIFCNQGTGGTSGGGEWRTPPDDPDNLPLDVDGGLESGGRGYSEPQASVADSSWTEALNSKVVRLVRFVGTTFSELF
jgi:hypothetical protein